MTTLFELEVQAMRTPERQSHLVNRVLVICGRDGFVYEMCEGWNGTGPWRRVSRDTALAQFPR